MNTNNKRIKTFKYLYSK
uniref:Uncharacterized protein n=1 Tax=Lepeophtheirus salmonis TaxID=72036 RepID=A0A0K2VG61_LEPSM